MNITKKHPREKWEVSLIDFQEDRRKRYKVTKSLSEMSIAETRIFKTKKAAEKQFEEWLQ